MHTVLLVEDHPLNRKLFRDLLEMRFEVLEAGSAEEALALLEQHTPDLILLDMELPGMDGLSLTRKLKADPQRQHIPVIALSGHGSQRDIELARAAGCADYITKPVTDDPFTFLDRLSRPLAPRSE